MYVAVDNFINKDYDKKLLRTGIFFLYEDEMSLK